MRFPRFIGILALLMASTVLADDSVCDDVYYWPQTSEMQNHAPVSCPWVDRGSADTRQGVDRESVVSLSWVDRESLAKADSVAPNVRILFLPDSISPQTGRVVRAIIYRL